MPRRKRAPRVASWMELTEGEQDRLWQGLESLVLEVPETISWPDFMMRMWREGRTNGVMSRLQKPLTYWTVDRVEEFWGEMILQHPEVQVDVFTLEALPPGWRARLLALTLQLQEDYEWAAEGKEAWTSVVESLPTFPLGWACVSRMKQECHWTHVADFVRNAKESPVEEGSTVEKVVAPLRGRPPGRRSGTARTYRDLPPRDMAVLARRIHDLVLERRSSSGYLPKMVWAWIRTTLKQEPETARILRSVIRSTHYWNLRTLREFFTWFYEAASEPETAVVPVPQPTAPEPMPEPASAPEPVEEPAGVVEMPPVFQTCLQTSWGRADVVVELQENQEGEVVLMLRYRGPFDVAEVQQNLDKLSTVTGVLMSQRNQ